MDKVISWLPFSADEASQMAVTDVSLWVRQNFALVSSPALKHTSITPYVHVSVQSVYQFDQRIISFTCNEIVLEAINLNQSGSDQIKRMRSA